MDNISYYINIIKSALNNIEQYYYKIKTLYSKEGIVRERVFCYELYHQIRLIDNRKDLSIHGEIDKRGHDGFSKDDRKNPDFIFHIPETFDKNTIVMEVKGSLNGSIKKSEEEGKLSLNYEGIYKDLNTLQIFINEYYYKEGVFVLYNHTPEELIKFIDGKNQDFFINGKWDRITTIFKKDSRTGCIERKLVDLLEETSLLD